MGDVLLCCEDNRAGAVEAQMEMLLGVSLVGLMVEVAKVRLYVSYAEHFDAKLKVADSYTIDPVSSRCDAMATRDTSSPRW